MNTDRLRLLNTLKSCRELSDLDPEDAHARADQALLNYINDPAITEAWESIKKWFA